jgi:hypothetical protein
MRCQDEDKEILTPVGCDAVARLYDEHSSTQRCMRLIVRVECEQARQRKGLKRRTMNLAKACLSDLLRISPKPTMQCGSNTDVWTFSLTHKSPSLLRPRTVGVFKRSNVLTHEGSLSFFLSTVIERSQRSIAYFIVNKQDFLGTSSIDVNGQARATTSDGPRRVNASLTALKRLTGAIFPTRQIRSAPSSAHHRFETLRIRHIWTVGGGRPVAVFGWTDSPFYCTKHAC